MLSRVLPSSDPPEIFTVNGDGTSFGDNQQQIRVDLPKADLGYEDPVSKFSIRDYVFTTRGKDLENHWPFSKKSLQLCLRHRVQHVLPPYQSLSSGGNQFSVGNVSEKVEDSSRELFELRKTPGFEGDSVLVAENCSLEPQAEKLTKNPELALNAATDTVRNNIPNPVKKYGSGLKLSCTAEQKTKEVLPGNSSLVLQAMASKICPICKTFSSTSNTTLNAHIDQCLSVEPTNKCISNSAIKHKMRARKTRLMVDIYATSLQCTLEDLEKRNGIIQAAFSGYQEPEGRSVEKNTVLSPDNIEDNNHGVCSEDMNNRPSISHVNENEEAVYIDSSGRKLRILSKPTLPQEKPGQKGDGESKGTVKNDKDKRSVSGKKNQHLNQRHKMLQCPPRGSYSCIPRNILKARNGDEESSHHEEYESDDVHSHSNACDQVTCHGSESRSRHLKIYNHEWKIKKTRSALLGYRSTIKTNGSTPPTLATHDISLSAEGSKSSHEFAELQSLLRKRGKNCISESREKMMVQKRISRTFVESESERSAQTRFSFCKKKSQDRAMFSGGEGWAKKLKRGKDTKSSMLCHSVSSGEEATVNPIQGHDNHFEKTPQLENAPCRSVESLEFRFRKQRHDTSNTCKDQDYASMYLDTSHERETRGVEKDCHLIKGTDCPVSPPYKRDALKKAQIQQLNVSKKTTSKRLGKEDSVVSHDSASLHGNLLDGHLVTHFETEMNGFEEQDKYSFDVDPIKIPEPPGSFLPSQGRVGSEEPQGNSSLTTCRVHSSEDEHELANTESANSPVSGTSFVSNPFTAGTVRVSGVSYNETPQDVALGYPIVVGSIGHETESHKSVLGSSRFKSGESYICEGVEQDVPLESWPRPMLVPSIPFTFQMDHGQTKECCHDFSVRSKNVLNGSTTAPASFYFIASGTPSCQPDARFSTYDHCVSFGSSPSPVLRLMGKNLMVVDKNESHLVANVPSTSNAQDCPSSQSATPGSTRNCTFPQQMDSYPYHHSGSRTDFGGCSGFRPPSAGLTPRNNDYSSLRFAYNTQGAMIQQNDPIQFPVSRSL